MAVVRYRGLLGPTPEASRLLTTMPLCRGTSALTLDGSCPHTTAFGTDTATDVLTPAQAQRDYHHRAQRTSGSFGGEDDEQSS